METKLKFKVGDKVRVKSLEWYNSEKKDAEGCILKGYVFTKEMSYFCENILTIEDVYSDFYSVKETNYNWEDWMLEDDAVTEEKQEVEQLQNKKNMKTKKMTLKEAQNYVKNTKYIVWSEDESRQLQKKLFEFGCGWLCGGPIVSHIEQPFLLVDKDLRMFFVHKGAYGCFEESKKIYHSKDDIFNIKIEKQPKFDPNTLKPFDKVLVRDYKDNNWRCNLFDCILEKESLSYQCVTQCWNYCIPYNEETKHLLGTNDEAPDFYNIW